MAKKRKTKQQKIISRLRRELKQQKSVPAKYQLAPDPSPKTKIKPIKSVKSKREIGKKKLLFTYAPKLIKKDLVKTLLISLIFISLIIILKFVL